jgi:hypothetical protein
MKIYKLICKVDLNGNPNRKRWVVIRNDTDPSLVGEKIVCGMPFNAQDVPVGTTYETITTIPDSQP